MDKSKTQIKKLQQLSIRCQCSIVKDGFKVLSKKKTKISQILLQPNKHLLKVINNVSQKETQIIQFPINKLKAIHKKFIDEGKITLQFYSHSEVVIMKGLDVSAQNNQKQVYQQIFIDNASKENLQLLISNLIEMKKKINPSKQKIEGKSQNQVKQTKQKKRKPQSRQQDVVSRKDIMKLIKNDGKPVQKIISLKKVEKKKQKVLQLMNLPVIILHQIFTFCQFKLQYRLVSKQFGNYILKNILNLKLKDQIDQLSFNTLSKWAINVTCRMKNVKNISLYDKYQHKELVVNHAKTLKFGNWKEISARNIDQMKDSIFHKVSDFQYQWFKNGIIKTQREKYKCKKFILNGINELKHIQTPYCSSKLFLSIKNPEKIKQIKIGVLNQKSIQQKWTDLTSFLNLNCLWIQSLQCQGTILKSQMKNRKLQFPPNITTLAIGSYISHNILDNLPQKLQNLKIIGEQFQNNDLSNIYLPNLKLLDISQCPYLTGPEYLQQFSHIKVYTNWQKDKTNYANNYYKSQSIQIYTSKN